MVVVLAWLFIKPKDPAKSEVWQRGYRPRAGGGRFGDGFLGSAVGSLDEPLLASIGTNDIFDRVAQATVAATIGGTLAEISGGNFSNGAVTAAFQNLFNAQEYKAKLGDLPAEYRKKLQEAIIAAAINQREKYDALYEADPQAFGEAIDLQNATAQDLELWHMQIDSRVS